MKGARRVGFLLRIGFVLAVLTLTTCAWRNPIRYSEMSGFLEDYSILQEDETGFAYRNSNADWAAYDKVLFAPVTLWRGGEESLDEVTEQDLLRLATALHYAMRERLEEDYLLVDKAGPGVMHISLALTDARESDAVLDVLTADVSEQPPPTNDATVLAPATEAFVDAAKIEGEIRDGQTGELLVAVVRLWVAVRGSSKGESDSWNDVEQAFESWAGRVQERLREARRGEL